MASPAPLCTHVKTNGIVCGSPAVAGTELCYHHSAIKTATGHAGSGGRGAGGEFAPIPFVFPEDRASMQINFFLLLQAFNEGRVDLKHFKAMMSMLKSMAANLGKTGSLMESRDQGPGTGDQKGGAQGSGRRAQETSGHPSESARPIEFSPEMMAKLEQVEGLDPNDPSYADRVREAVAEGLEELKAQGLDLTETSALAASLAR